MSATIQHVACVMFSCVCMHTMNDVERYVHAECEGVCGECGECGE